MHICRNAVKDVIYYVSTGAPIFNLTAMVKTRYNGEGGTWQFAIYWLLVNCNLNLRFPFLIELVQESFHKGMTFFGKFPAVGGVHQAF